jgi:hypothetical protein
MVMWVHSEPRTSILKAAPKSKWAKTRTYTRLTNLSKNMAGAVRVDLVHGYSTFKKRVSAAKIEEFWISGDPSKIMAIIPWDDMHEDMGPARRTLAGTLTSAAGFSLERLPPPVKNELRFDMKNPSIRNFVDKRTGEWITDAKKSTQELIQQQVARSMNEALTPRQVAAEIKGTIGLGTRLTAAYQNYVRGMQGKDIPAANQQAYAAKKMDDLLQYRAMMIARTETRLATNQGQLAVWRQAADQSLIDRGTARKVWIVDGAPCEICEPMDGVAVPLDEFWTLPNGEQVDVPTESHPHCFCGMELDFGNSAQRLEDAQPEESEEE